MLFQVRLSAWLVYSTYFFKASNVLQCIAMYGKFKSKLVFFNMMIYYTCPIRKTLAGTYQICELNTYVESRPKFLKLANEQIRFQFQPYLETKMVWYRTDLIQYI